MRSIREVSFPIEGAGPAHHRSHTNPFSRSLLWRLAAPTCIAVALLVVGIGTYTPQAVVGAALEDAVSKSQKTAKQLQTLRSFYSENVVSKATKAGVKATSAYAHEPTAIPVPTTFILDVAKSYSDETLQVGLVSPYPWPLRKDRELDAFQKEAWDHLSKQPDTPFVRREQVSGREMLRVAVGDSMVESCVACHNSHPASPKTDWKVGDLRGLIEVSRPIDAITAGAYQLSSRIVAGVVLAGLLLLVILLAIGRKLIKPLHELSRAIGHIARGRLEEPIPHGERSDEVGTVARAVMDLQAQTSERARAEAQISYMAHHDGLTGLPNRVSFRDVMVKSLDGLAAGDAMSVLCLDLDFFKAVNDTLGHTIGDKLLQAVADRLRACAGEGDTVARLGGDEFAILQMNEGRPAAATDLARRLVEAVATPFDIEGHRVVVGISIGIAIAPLDSRDPDKLLKSADLALYRSKTVGRNTHCFFEPEMDARMQARRALELDLREALALEQFEVHYQPLLNLQANEVSGFEALLRWNHPTRGKVPPGDFISLAEEIGLINAIGAWVLHEACKDAAQWPEKLSVAVNLSPVQFRSSVLMLDVTAALEASGLAAGRLELEVTETVLLQDTEMTLATLHQLRGLGVRISMDDFGTGYSSLSYLRKFPFDKIKIDRSFVRDLASSDEAVAIVRSVAALGTSLGMATTAEGVETKEQLARVRAEGCTEVQGYLLSVPRPAADLPALLRQIERDLMDSTLLKRPSPQAVGGEAQTALKHTAPDISVTGLMALLDKFEGDLARIERDIAEGSAPDKRNSRAARPRRKAASETRSVDKAS